MKTVQRERRYVCGQTKQNAVYQEIEIYTVGTDQKSRQREKQKVTPVPFRGKNPEHWDGHNAKRARKWFIRLLNTNFTEAYPRCRSKHERRPWPAQYGPDFGAVGR